MVMYTMYMEFCFSKAENKERPSRAIYFYRHKKSWSTVSLSLSEWASKRERETSVTFSIFLIKRLKREARAIGLEVWLFGGDPHDDFHLLCLWIPKNVWDPIRKNRCYVSVFSWLGWDVPWNVDVGDSHRLIIIGP